MEFLNWFFSTPTAIIAVISAVIAYLAYIYQRRQIRKRCALEIARLYSKEMIPRIRYINKILEVTGAKKLIDTFTKLNEFTDAELVEQLKTQNFSIDKFKRLLRKINPAHLHAAYMYSGCGHFISEYHFKFLDIVQTKSDGIDTAFYQFIIDFLNDLESITMMFRYNIAEEELVYQSLHQTFLNNVKNWYFFISEKNTLDHDRYFSSIIWLYQKWNERKLNDRNKMGRFLKKSNNSRAKKL